MQKEIYFEEDEIDDKKKILIGMLDLIGIAIFTIVGLIIKNMYF